MYNDTIKMATQIQVNSSRKESFYVYIYFYFLWKGTYFEICRVSVQFVKDVSMSLHTNIAYYTYNSSSS